MKFKVISKEGFKTEFLVTAESLEDLRKLNGFLGENATYDTPDCLKNCSGWGTIEVT